MKDSKAVAVAVCVVLAITGCTESDAPKTPLGAAAPVGTQNAALTINGEAKLALDSANLSFRAKAYDRALVQYQRSAKLAPAEMAPLLGILMVADVTGDAKLAESTRVKMRELDPAAADSSIASPHTRIPEGHPPLTTPPTRQ